MAVKKVEPPAARLKNNNVRKVPPKNQKKEPPKNRKPEDRVKKPKAVREVKEKPEKQVQQKPVKQVQQKPVRTKKQAPGAVEEHELTAAERAEMAKKLKQSSKKSGKKDRFIVPRMWVSTVVSMMFNDRGTIPPNIGNNIMVTNNLYITKNSLSSVIYIGEFSDDTPVGFCSDLINDVKSKVKGVKVDITIKSQPYYIDLSASGMKSRIHTWESLLNSPTATERQARRAARQLYTVSVAESGEHLYKSRVYITIRASNGNTLNQGISAVEGYLASCALYRNVKSKLQENLDFMTIMCDKTSKEMKNVGWMITSQQVLAEMFPQTQGLNDDRGTMFGLTRENNSPYWINFRKTANAKNIYVCAKSGFGKTFMVLSVIIDGYADGYNICIMDIKGTEFTAFTKACGGVILSMRADDTHFVNCFVMDVNDVEDGNYGVYFNRRIRMSKKRMMIMCQFTENERARGEALIDEFLAALYLNKGVTQDNPNTWIRTEELHPYVVYDLFEEYVSREVKEKYGEIATSALSRIRTYMSRKGNSSHIHRDAYAYREVLQTKVLTFDFGILEDSASNVDPVIFQLRVMDMEIINDEYVSYKKKHGEWTMKVLEESQVCADYLLEIYVREMTLRRAQNQVTFLLGNAVSALQSNPVAKPLLESLNILILGVINDSNQDYFVNEYDLGQENKKKMKLIAEDTRYIHNFLLVNRMQQDATTAIVKTYVPKSVSQGKLFKVVDVEE